MARRSDGTVTEISTTILVESEPSEGHTVLLRSLLGTTILDLDECLMTPEEAEDVRWYHEEHALQDPFSQDRAISVEELLTRKGQALGRCLKVEVGKLETAVSGLQVIELLVSSDLTSMTIPWEVLEAKSMWPEDVLLDVRVCRYVCSQSVTPRNDFVVKRMGTINILFVSARPAYGNDVPYRLISKPLWQMIHDSPELRDRVRWTFVRPGTWMALKRALNKHSPGYFKIVHFDVHGGLKKTKRRTHGATAQLVNGVFLTSRNSSNLKPDFRTATEVGDLLAQYQVSTAVFNACNTGGAYSEHGRHVQSLAATLCQRGVEQVVAMSYAVLADTANILMQALYEELLLWRNTLLQAATSARLRAAENTARSARFGMTVNVNDSLVLVLHMSLPKEDVARLLKVSERKRAISSHGPDSSVASDPGMITEELQGRDGDLLALEAAFSEVNCVNVVAPGGSGKTTFARYAVDWWQASGFIDEAITFDLHHEPDLFRTDGGIYFRICPDTALQEAISYVQSRRIMIVIDNWEAAILSERWTEEQFHNLGHFLDFTQEESCDFLVLLISSVPPHFSHNPSSPDNSVIRIVEMGPSNMQDTLRIATRLMKNAGEKYNPNMLTSQHLENLLDKHGCNLLFCNLFMPLVEDVASVKQLSHDLLMSFPPKGSESLENYSIDRSVPPSWTLAAFEQAFATITEKGEATLFILLSLAPFTMTYSRMLCLHVLRLRDRELCVDGRITFDKLKELSALQGNDIRGYTLDTANAALSKEGRDPLIDEYYFVRNTLASFGLVKAKPSGLDGDVGQQLEVDILHPLLPYLIRHKLQQFESSRPDLTSIADVARLCDTMFWESFELRARAMTQQPELAPTMIQTVIENEWENFRKATELCLDQPQYGKGPMILIALIEVFSQPYYLRIKTRRSDMLELTNSIIVRYTNTQTSDTEVPIPYHMVVQTLSTIQARLECLGLIADVDGADDLVNFGKKLIQELPESLIHEDCYVKDVYTYFTILELARRLQVWSRNPPIREMEDVIIAAQRVAVTSKLAIKVVLGVIQCLLLVALSSNFRGAFLNSLGRKRLIDETAAIFTLWSQVRNSQDYRFVDFSQLDGGMKDRRKLLDLAWTLESPDHNPAFEQSFTNMLTMNFKAMNLDRTLSNLIVEQQSDWENTANSSLSMRLIEGFSQAGMLPGQIDRMKDLFTESIRSKNLQAALTLENQIRGLEGILTREAGDDVTQLYSWPGRAVHLAVLILDKDELKYNSDVGRDVTPARREWLMLARSLSLSAIDATEWLPRPLTSSSIYALEVGTNITASVANRLNNIVEFLTYTALYRRLLLTRMTPSDGIPGLWDQYTPSQSIGPEGRTVFDITKYTQVGDFLGIKTPKFWLRGAQTDPAASEDDGTTVSTPALSSPDDIVPHFCTRFPWWTRESLSAFIGSLSLLQFTGNVWPESREFEDLPSHAKIILREAESCLIFPPDDPRLSSLTMWSLVEGEAEGENDDEDNGNSNDELYRFYPKDVQFWEEEEVIREFPVYKKMWDGSAWATYDTLRFWSVEGHLVPFLEALREREKEST